MFIILLVSTLAFLIAFLYLILDYLGPQRIPLQSDNKFGMTCFRVHDLIVQEFDRKDNLWATRGLLIYYLRNGEDKFKKVARVPSGFSFFWLNNFTIIRKFTLRPECVEMSVNDAGYICAFSSGRMWISQGIGKKFNKTLKLPNYGIGVGRGIMSTGLAQVNDEEFSFGEYFNNPERSKVRIYKYKNTNRLWEKVYEFLPGQIRHIHALQKDPYTGKLWICTGDEDNEALIGWSDDNFKTIVTIGQGSQKWRACQLVFTEEAIYWGTDTGEIDSGGIYKWDKEKQEVKRLQSIPGAIFFGTRLANGTIVMSTDREGFPNETDDKTRLFIINKENKITTIDCGTWNYKKSGFRFNFAKLRMHRIQGSHKLAISCLNLKEVPDGDLLIYSEEELS
jgi:hypothetical protein